MSADVLVSRLDGVVSTGKGTWRARCPSHGSRGRTLAVKEAEDGTVLVKCFADCSIGEVLGAVGLGVSDLFPEALPQSVKREYFPAGDVLRCLTEESTIVLLASQDTAVGKKLNEVDQARLVKATSRIHAGLGVVR